MDGFKKTLIRKLKFKSKEAREELLLCKEIYDQAFPSFYKAVSDYCSKNNLEDPFSKLTSIKKEKKPSLTKNLKSIFRKIATKTHTDLTKDESTREILEEAVEAKKQNKSHDLLHIAKELNIDTSNIDYESIRHLEKSIHELEQEIKSIRDSYPWVWFYSDLHKKNIIIKLFVSIKV